MVIEDYKREFVNLLAKKQALQTSIKDKRESIVRLSERQSDALSARIVIQEVAKQTQKNLEFHFSNLVTTALLSVCEDWPTLAVKFETRRNQTECDLFFNHEGELDDPMESSGGGPKDIASFALRIAFWNLCRNRPVFILDEPFRNVSPNLQRKVSEMVKMVSIKLGIQIIMVSHADEININADQTFMVTKKGKYSEISVYDSDL